VVVIEASRVGAGVESVSLDHPAESRILRRTGWSKGTWQRLATASQRRCFGCAIAFRWYFLWRPKGFTLDMVKAVLNGTADEAIDLGRSNLWR
jgi:hypothetical protein